jgi:hypothetical protein
MCTCPVNLAEEDIVTAVVLIDETVMLTFVPPFPALSTVAITTDGTERYALVKE